MNEIVEWMKGGIFVEAALESAMLDDWTKWLGSVNDNVDVAVIPRAAVCKICCKTAPSKN